MTTRRVPWWLWSLVAAPWAAGLGWAVFAVLTGRANREIVLRGPATVAAIVAGSAVTVVAAAVLLSFRTHRSGLDVDRPATPDEPSGPPGSPTQLRNQLDRDVDGRLASVRDLLATVRTAAARGLLTPADVTALDQAASEVADLVTLLTEVGTLANLQEAPSNPGPFDVDAVLADVAALVTASPGLGGRRLVRPAAEPGATTGTSALGDRDLLFLALHKIVLTALGSSRPDSTITMRASHRGAEVVVEVSDTGRGIPADQMPHLWDPVNAARSTERAGGAGLGLSLAKVAVERHGGAIRARSREGLGTVVTIVLPAARPGR